jgi:hypothetical protein
LVKIHWRMLILECSQGYYGRTEGIIFILWFYTDIFLYNLFFCWFISFDWIQTTWVFIG